MGKLNEALKAAQTEEDVKSAYIKALGIVDCTMGEVDIRTPLVWFEAKKGGDWTVCPIISGGRSPMALYPPLPPPTKR